MSINEFIVKLQEQYPIHISISMVVIGLFIIAYQIKSHGSNYKKDMSYPAWALFVNSWGLGIVLVLGGLIILSSNI